MVGPLDVKEECGPFLVLVKKRLAKLETMCGCEKP